MKRATLLLISWLIALNVFSQLSFENNLTDGFDPVVINVISEQKNPGIDFVNYLNSESIFEVQAKDDQPYEYYEGLYNKYRSTRNYGIMMTVVGAGMLTISALINNDAGYNDNVVTGLNIGGGILFDVGAFFWIYNGIRSKNNKKAMERVGK